MVRPRSPLRNFDRTCQALPTFVGYLSTTDTVTLTSDTPAILTTVPETWTVNSSCPWKSAFAVYEKDGPWISTLPDCGGAISFTSFMDQVEEEVRKNSRRSTMNALLHTCERSPIRNAPKSDNKWVLGV